MCKGVGLGDILNILRDCLAARGVPPKGGASKRKKPICRSADIAKNKNRLQVSLGGFLFLLCPNGLGFFFFGGEGGIRTPGTLTSSAV